jgi:ssDNA-binding Zn-finger/Zn-ribbon topoisomerase 1
MSLFDDITAGLDAVFNRRNGTAVTKSHYTAKGRNPKHECDACGKIRVLATWEHGGDTMHWCYNCSDSMFGHTYNSSKLSRREFYGRIYNG